MKELTGAMKTRGRDRGTLWGPQRERVSEHLNSCFVLFSILSCAQVRIIPSSIIPLPGGTRIMDLASIFGCRSVFVVLLSESLDHLE